MSYTLTPNMSLVVPTVGSEPGPTYATDINNSLTIIDGHTHTSGNGVLITPGAIDINADLTMNDNSLIDIQALEMNPQSVSPGIIETIYVSSDGNLHYIDGSSNDIKMTSGGLVNATSSGIASGTATASFVSGTLVVDANTATPANIQAASLLMGNNVASSNYLTLEPPSAMGTSYTVTLPTPNGLSQTGVLTYDVSNNMGSITYDAVGQGMTSVGANAIKASTTMSVGSGIGQINVSASCGNFSHTSGSTDPITNLSINITTSGRPVMIVLSPDTNGVYVSTIGSGSGPSGQLYFYRGGTQLFAGAEIQSSSAMFLPPGAMTYIDYGVAGSPGTYTYAAYAHSTISVQYCVLVAYEL